MSSDEPTFRDGCNMKASQDSGLGYKDAKRALHVLMRHCLKAQQALDKICARYAADAVNELAMAGGQLNLDPLAGLSGRAEGGTDMGKVPPLPGLVPLKRYRISEVVIEFDVVAEDEDTKGVKGNDRFSMAASGLQNEQMQPARIRIINDKSIIGELQVAGDVKETAVLKYETPFGLNGAQEGG